MARSLKQKHREDYCIDELVLSNRVLADEFELVKPCLKAHCNLLAALPMGTARANLLSVSADVTSLLKSLGPQLPNHVGTAKPLALTAVVSHHSAQQLARTALLLLMMLDSNPDDPADMQTLWNVWFNTWWQPATWPRFKAYVQRLLSMDRLPWLRVCSDGDKAALDAIFRWWLNEVHPNKPEPADLKHDREGLMARLQYCNTKPLRAAEWTPESMPPAGTPVVLKLPKLPLPDLDLLAKQAATKVLPLCGWARTDGSAEDVKMADVVITTFKHWFTTGTLKLGASPPTCTSKQCLNVTMLDPGTGDWMVYPMPHFVDCWGPLNAQDVRQAVASGAGGGCVARLYSARLAAAVRDFQRNTNIKQSSQVQARVQLQVHLLCMHPLDMLLHVPTQQLLQQQDTAASGFDVIDTGDLGDEVGLLPLIVAAGPRLAPAVHARLHCCYGSSVKEQDTMRQHLIEVLGVGQEWMPTIFGLRLLTDLQLDAPKPEPVPAPIGEAAPWTLTWCPAGAVFGPSKYCVLPELRLPKPDRDDPYGIFKQPWGPPDSLAQALRQVDWCCCSGMHDGRFATMHTFAWLLVGCVHRMDMRPLVADVQGTAAAARSHQPDTADILKAARTRFAQVLDPPMRVAFQAAMDVVLHSINPSSASEPPLMCIPAESPTSIQPRGALRGCKPRVQMILLEPVTPKPGMSCVPGKVAAAMHWMNILWRKNVDGDLAACLQLPHDCNLNLGPAVYNAPLITSGSLTPLERASCKMQPPQASCLGPFVLPQTHAPAQLAESKAVAQLVSQYAGKATPGCSLQVVSCEETSDCFKVSLKAVDAQGQPIDGKVRIAAKPSSRGYAAGKPDEVRWSCSTADLLLIKKMPEGCATACALPYPAAVGLKELSIVPGYCSRDGLAKLGMQICANKAKDWEMWRMDLPPNPLCADRAVDLDQLPDCDDWDPTQRAVVPHMFPRGHEVYNLEAFYELHLLIYYMFRMVQPKEVKPHGPGLVTLKVFTPITKGQCQSSRYRLALLAVPPVKLLPDGRPVVGVVVVDYDVAHALAASGKSFELLDSLKSDSERKDAGDLTPRLSEHMCSEEGLSVIRRYLWRNAQRCGPHTLKYPNKSVSSSEASRLSFFSFITPVYIERLKRVDGRATAAADAVHPVADPYEGLQTMPSPVGVPLTILKAVYHLGDLRPFLTDKMMDMARVHVAKGVHVTPAEQEAYDAEREAAAKAAAPAGGAAGAITAVARPNHPGSGFAFDFRQWGGDASGSIAASGGAGAQVHESVMTFGDPSLAAISVAALQDVGLTPPHTTVSGDDSSAPVAGQPRVPTTPGAPPTPQQAESVAVGQGGKPVVQEKHQPRMDDHSCSPPPASAGAAISPTQGVLAHAHVQTPAATSATQPVTPQPPVQASRADPSSDDDYDEDEYEDEYDYDDEYEDEYEDEDVEQEEDEAESRLGAVQRELSRLLPEAPPGVIEALVAEAIKLKDATMDDIIAHCSRSNPEAQGKSKGKQQAKLNPKSAAGQAAISKAKLIKFVVHMLEHGVDRTARNSSAVSRARKQYKAVAPLESSSSQPATAVKQGGSRAGSSATASAVTTAAAKNVHAQAARESEQAAAAGAAAKDKSAAEAAAVAAAAQAAANAATAAVKAAAGQEAAALAAQEAAAHSWQEAAAAAAAQGAVAAAVQDKSAVKAAAAQAPADAQAVAAGEAAAQQAAALAAEEAEGMSAVAALPFYSPVFEDLARLLVKSCGRSAASVLIECEQGLRKSGSRLAPGCSWDELPADEAASASGNK